MRHAATIVSVCLLGVLLAPPPPCLCGAHEVDGEAAGSEVDDGCCPSAKAGVAEAEPPRMRDVCRAGCCDPRPELAEAVTPDRTEYQPPVPVVLASNIAPEPLTAERHAVLGAPMDRGPPLTVPERLARLQTYLC